MRRRNHILLSATIILAASVLPVSCTEKFLQQDERTYPVEISMKTKAGVEDEPEKEYNETTYCFSLISTAQGTAGDLVSEGTYCDPKDDATYLTACSVDADGDWVSDDKSCGLYAANATYKMAAASPALPMVRIGETGNKYGYWYNRVLDTEGGERRLFVSDAMDIQLYGEMARETPSSGSYAYIYKVPESKPLRERRSVMNIRLICGEELTDFTVGYMSVRNCMARAAFIPAVGAFDPQNAEYDSDGFDVEHSWPVTVVSGDSLTVARDIPLLAADYSLVDDTGKNIYTPTVIHFKLGDGLDAPEYDLGLAFNIKPQCTYTVNITANTIHISVRVYAAEWGQKSVSGDIDAQPEFGDLVFVGEWSGGHGDSGEID